MTQNEAIDIAIDCINNYIEDTADVNNEPSVNFKDENEAIKVLKTMKR